MSIDLGNLSLGIETRLTQLDALETRLTALQKTFGPPLVLTVNTGNAQQSLQNMTTAATNAGTSLKSMSTVVDQTGVVTQRLTTETTAQAAALEKTTAARVQGITQLNAERAATEQARASLVAARTEQVNAKTAIMETGAASRDSAASVDLLNNKFVDGVKSIAGFAAGILGVTVAIEGTRVAFDDIIGGTLRYQTAITQSANNTTMTTAEIAKMDQTIRQMAANSPASLQALTDGFRQAYNLIGTTSGATVILDAAMKSAVSTGGDVSQTTRILATVMRDFNIPLSQAAVAMDQLHIAAAAGSVTLEQFTNSAAPALAVASAYGVSLGDAAAALTAFTRQGLTAEESATALMAIIKGIAQPSATAEKSILALSQATGVDLVDAMSPAGLQTLGLSGVLDKIRQATGGATDELIKLIPQARGTRAELILAGEGFGAFTDALTNQADVVSGKLTPTQDAYNRTLATAEAQWDILKNKLQLIALAIGQVLLPALQAAVAWVAQLADAFGVVFDVPGLSKLNTDIAGLNDKLALMDQGAKTAGTSLTGAGDDGSTAMLDAATSAEAAKQNVADLSAKALEASTNIADLNTKIAANKTLTDDDNASIKAITDTYTTMIRGVQDQIAKIEQLSPGELARKATELQQQADLAKLNATKPDLSNYDDTIAALEQDKNNLVAPDLSGFDTQITTLQDTISNLNTNELDAKIAAVRDTLSQPAPDTSGLTNTLVSLSAQLAGPGADRTALLAQYGAASRQKQGLLDTYNQSHLASQSQLTTLEQQKRDADAANAITRQSDELKLKGIEAARTAATKAHENELANYDKEIAGLKLKEAAMLAPWQRQVDAINKNLAAEKALDDLARANRDVQEFPLKNVLSDLTDAENKALQPLKDRLINLQDQNAKLQEQKQYWADIKQGEDNARAAANQAATAAKNANPFANQGGGAGGAFGSAALGAGKGYAALLGQSATTPPLAQSAQQFMEQNTTTLPSVAENPMVQYVQQLKDALDHLFQWFDGHKGGIADGIKKVMDGIPGQLKASFDFFSQIGNIFTLLGTVLDDINSGNFGALRKDGPAFSDAIDRAFGAGNYSSAAAITAGGGGMEGSPVARPASSPSLIGNNQIVAGQIGTGDFTGTNPKNPGAPTPAMNSIAQGGQSVFDWIKDRIHDAFGSQSVSAQDLSTFDDTQNNLLGPDGRLTTNITDSGTTVTGSWGPDGTWDKALGNANTTATDTFGDGNGVQIPIGQLNAYAQRVFGANGDLHGYLTTDTPNILRGLVTEVQSHFGPGMDAQKPLADYSTFMGGIFGSNGTAQTIFGVDVPAWLAPFVTTLEQHFGEGGTARTPFTGFGDFVSTLFKTTLPTAAGGLGPALDGVMPSDIAPLQGFMTSVATAVRQIGTLFKIPDLMNFNPDVSYHAGASAAVSVGSALSAQIGHAAGLIDNPAGHMAMIGERGPEAMWIPKGASIIPNHLLPGHADGYNLAPFTLPGAFNPIAATLFGDATTGIAALLAQHQAGKFGGSRGGRGTGFAAMDAAAFMAYMAAFGGPLDNAGAFNDLEAVGSERGVDPRWFMAIMQTEDGFGTAAGDLLPQYNNYGGMGVRAGGLGYPSPVFATDGGPQPYAAFHSFHDFLEDEASWIIENGTSFAGYQTADAGQGKNAAYQAILAAIPIVGNALSSGGASIEGMDGAQLLGIAMGDLAGTAGYCEQYVGDVMQSAGLRYARAATALQHAGMQSLSPGLGPAGAIAFFDWQDLGHVAFSMGDNANIWGTQSGPAGGQVGEYAASLPQLGYTVNPAAGGAFVTSPTLLLSGEGGDKEGEVTSPVAMLRKIISEEGGATVSVGGVTINLTPPPGTDATRYGKDFGEGFLTTLREHGRVATH